jgi:hypothetical protein
MKTTNRKSLLVAAVCAVALSFGTAAYAEKGAEALLRLGKGAAPANTGPVAVTAHACVGCTDTFVRVADNGAKGANRLLSGANGLTTYTVRHDCAGCDTKIVTQGAGKAKKDMAIHTCGANVKAACCASN